MSAAGGKSKARPLYLRESVEAYFLTHLPQQRGCAPKTIESYREAFSRFAEFLRERFGRKNLDRFPVCRVTPEVVLSFLNHLEKNRGNAASTRNQRLSAIRSFCRHVAVECPQLESQCRRILMIPTKIARSRSFDYLDEEELACVFEQIDTSSDLGFRDYAILYFMYNTGCRASEAAHLRTGDLVFERPYARVRFRGKGGRLRDCPLWDSTVVLLSSYLKNVRKKPRPPYEDRAFINERRLGFTRQGLREILLRYVRPAAAAAQPSLKHKRITTHSMRHTTAVHLLKAGVDLSVIRAWLGHLHLDTTLLYARADTASKAEALKRFQRLAEFLPSRVDPPAGLPDSTSIRRWIKKL